MDYMTFKKKKEFQEFCYLTLEFTIKMSIMEECWHCKDRPVDQWNRTETPAINSYTSVTLHFAKDINMVQWTKDIF